MSARPLWTLTAMATAMAATRMGALPRDVSGISIDSRTVAAGEAFFAIKGDTHDGHGFVAAALKNGAGLAVVAETKRSEMPESASAARCRRARRCSSYPMCSPASSISAARRAPARTPR